METAVVFPTRPDPKRYGLTPERIRFFRCDTDYSDTIVFIAVGSVVLLLLFRNTTSSSRKLPRQADSSQGDNPALVGLGRNVRGGTRPRLSCGRSWL